MNTQGEVIASFFKPVQTLPQEEYEKYAALFRKLLSGTQGQNMLRVDFGAAQTMRDPAHELLMSLCRTELEDEAVCGELDRRILSWLAAERGDQAQSVEAQQHGVHRLILTLYDCCDVPHRRADGEEEAERSGSVFNYVLCCVCPVRRSKASLSYVEQAADFRSMDGLWSVASPELGFMFPMFEQGGADLYSALFYTRDIADAHELFLEKVFAAPVVMTAAEQKEALHAILADSLAEECSMETVQAVHEQISGMISEQKADKLAEPLQLSVREVRRVLEDCGVSEAKADVFEQRCGDTFGTHAEIPAVNVVSPKEFRVATPSVTIRVDPAHAGLVSTRVIDGQRCIVIVADGNVEVNGVSVSV